MSVGHVAKCKLSSVARKWCKQDTEQTRGKVGYKSKFNSRKCNPRAFTHQQTVKMWISRVASRADVRPWCAGADETRIDIRFCRRWWRRDNQSCQCPAWLPPYEPRSTSVQATANSTNLTRIPISALETFADALYKFINVCMYVCIPNTASNIKK